MLLKIARAMADFQRHLIDNAGNQIDLSTIRAFADMQARIIQAVYEELDK